MMSDPHGASVSSSTDSPADPPREQRQWIRHNPGEMRCTLTWDEGADHHTCRGVVMNLHGQGAAVLADRAPAVGQVIWVQLESGSEASKPLEARSVGTSVDPAGKRLINLRFTTWISLEVLFGRQQQERRLWQRYPARESRAVLTWLESDREKTIQAELLNISGGGAAFKATVEPPFDRPIWFGLEAMAAGIDPVEAQLVGISLDPSGSKIVRFRFVAPCPIELFELAVHGPK
jgi:hypothetical protein